MNAGSLELLDWDSRFFQLKIARLTRPPESREALEEALRAARTDRIDCVYALVPADAPEAGWLLEDAGFVARDVRLEFSRAVDKRAIPSDVREWSEPDLHPLEEIATTAFSGTRFAADPRFPRDAVQNLYRTWIRNSCHGFAQSVLVEGPVGAPHGFVTLHREPDGVSGRIGLIGIASASRAKGVGTRLVTAALGWAASRQFHDLKVVTQAGNIGAQRLYQRAGFTTVSAATWYHGWPSR